MAIKVNDSNFMNSFLLDMLTSLSINASTLTLIEKSIEDNGTYDAEDDSADGYSSVTANIAKGYSLPDDATYNLDGADFENGVLNIYKAGQNELGGVAYPLSGVTITSDTTVVFIFKCIANMTGTAWTDNGFFKIGAIGGETGEPWLIVDTWNGFRLGTGIVGGSESWADATGVYPSIGPLYIKITITAQSTKFETSTDGTNYTIRVNRTFDFTDKTFSRIVIGRASTTLQSNTYNFRESVDLIGTTLTKDGVKVRDFVV